MIITHGGTLPDISNKPDFYAIIDNATGAGVVNADCSNSMALADSKLAQIVTASKVAGTALTGLSGIPSGAGVIPGSNLPFGGGGLGSWVDKSASYGAQQAATDGFVLANISGNGPGTVRVYSDANTDPGTIRGNATAENGHYNQVFTPVKNNHYWKVTLDAGATIVSVYWIPLGV